MTEQVSLPYEISNRSVIGDLISRMMQKDPSKRYQTLTEVKKHAWLSDIDWTILL